MAHVEIPLARCADELIGALASATQSAAIADLDGATLLGERAMLAGFRIPSLTSAGGGCRLLAARDGLIALNLARRDDRELLPALFATDLPDIHDDAVIANCIAAKTATELLERGRLLGLAIAMEHEAIATSDPSIELVRGIDRMPVQRPPRVIDLSALWAGPLASHLLQLAGADIVKVESRARPDAMRTGEPAFFALLNQRKQSVQLDFRDARERQALHALVCSADIVIEAARPRALLQLGIDAEQIVRKVPGLVWITITAHGARGEAANWVGFGDDCAVAGGLSAALRAASGRSGFVGDAIADPLTGLLAALTAWWAWRAGRGGRFGVAMRHVIAHCLSQATRTDAAALQTVLAAWSRAAGESFPVVRRRQIGPLAALGEHTEACLAGLAPC